MFGLILAGLKRRRDAGIAAVHRDELRQHSRQRPRHAERRRRPGRAGRSRARALGRDERRLPQRHGRPHHAGHHRPRAAAAARAVSASRTTGRCSARGSGNGCWRTISPPAARRWKQVGVQFVADVAPFELMKIRILNGGHATIAYPAALLDIHFVHEAMENPLVARFPRQGRAGRDHPGRAAGAGHRPRRLFPADRPALRQSQDRRHHPPALPRRLQPPAEIHPALRRRPAEGRQVGRPAWRSSRRSGAATATARPTAARRSRRTIRTGTAWWRRRGRPRPTRRPGSAWKTSMATSANRRFSDTAFATALNALWTDGTKRDVGAVYRRGWVTACSVDATGEDDIVAQRSTLPLCPAGHLPPRGEIGSFADRNVAKPA